MYKYVKKSKKNFYILAVATFNAKNLSIDYKAPNSVSKLSEVVYKSSCMALK